MNYVVIVEVQLWVRQFHFVLQIDIVEIVLEDKRFLNVANEYHLVCRQCDNFHMFSQLIDIVLDVHSNSFVAFPIDTQNIWSVYIHTLIRVFRVHHMEESKIVNYFLLLVEWNRNQFTHISTTIGSIDTIDFQFS